MARKKKPLPILEDITITDYAAEGKSLARVNDMVVFVPWAVPGDVCDLQVRRKKHSFMEAEVIRYKEYSKVRTQPFCQHFGVCGGCKWQQLPYEEQLRMKQQQIYDQLTRIGKVELPEFRPILGSVKTQEYRNKLDFGCANKRYLTKEQIQTLPNEESQSLKDVPAIGFHITGAFDKILPIEKCWLMDDLQNQIRNEIRDYAINNGLSFFDLRQQVGLLRDVIVRNSNTGEWMVIIQFHYDRSSEETAAKSQEEALELLQHVADHFPQITSLLYLDNQKCNDTIGDQEIITYKGADHIFLYMEDLKFNGETMWEYWPDVKIDNAAKFSAMPVGYATVLDGVYDFFNYGDYTVFWTSSENEDGDSGIYRYIYVDKNIVFRGTGDKDSFAASVRCVR